MTKAEIIIACWSDWVLPQDAVCEVIARVGRKHELGLALINQSLHNGQLQMMLIAPDGTPTLFSKTECEGRTIHAPLNPREGTRIEPYEPGQHFVRGVVKLAFPATPAAAADRQLPAADESEPAARAEESMPEAAPPTESPRVEPVPPPEPVPAADMRDQAGGVTAAIETAASPPKKRRRRRRGRRPKKKDALRLLPRGTRGPPPETTNRVVGELRDSIQNGRYTMQGRRLFEGTRRALQKTLMAAHKCGKSTLLDALNIVRSELETPTKTPTETPTETPIKTPTETLTKTSDEK